ncbi:MAG TPA: UDP-glucose 4-epimerase [Rheinheimera sp.]|nr:UDP-glucose 4-epimerase [Rheinheimera sp.]
MTRVLLTGATGFVGSAVLASLPASTRVLGRTVPELPCEFFKAELLPTQDFLPALQGIDVVVHCAARAHVMHETSVNPLEQYRLVNTHATLALAQQAAQAGVTRFVFVSSVKVNGEETLPQRPFTHLDVADPVDPYGLSKAEAEWGLRKIGQETGMEITVIRPPLVYGPGVKANFAAMLKLAKRNLPLPFGAVRNARSLVALDNLVDLIKLCIEHPAAANQTFLVSDGHDVSTTELLQEMTKAWGKQPRLIPIPVGLLRWLLRLLGKQAISERLFGSLQVDISHTRQTLGWAPKPLLAKTLQQCVKFVK